MRCHADRQMLVAWVCVVVAACPTALPEEAPSQDAVQKLQRGAETIRLRLNACLRKEQIEFPVRGKMPLPVHLMPRRAATGPRTILGGTQSGVEFAFCADTERIKAFFHWSAAEQAFGAGAPRFEGPPEAQWSKERAVHVGAEILTAILGAFPNNVALGKVEHVYPVRESPQYYAGVWQITYVRIDDRGNRFENDGITLEILEQYGPYIVGVNMESEYSEPPRQPIPKEDAIAASRPFANRLARSDLARSWYGQFALTGNATAKMLIVNPNALLKAKSADDIRAQESSIARLAWQVSHEIVLNDTRLADEGAERKANLLIWIDATTGACLGGDLH